MIIKFKKLKNKSKFESKEKSCISTLTYTNKGVGKSRMTVMSTQNSLLLYYYLLNYLFDYVFGYV